MKILLLAGTAEARAIANGLAGRRQVEVVASLAGATRRPLDLPCATRIGGFGGADGFRAALAAGGFMGGEPIVAIKMDRCRLRFTDGGKDRAPRRGVTAPVLVRARVCPDGQSAVSAAGADAFS